MSRKSPSNSERETKSYLAMDSSRAVPTAAVTRPTSVSGSRSEELLNSVDGIIWEAERVEGSTFRNTFVSQHAERLLGYPLSNWLEKPAFWEEIFHPDDLERVTIRFNEALRDLTDYNIEFRLVPASGLTICPTIWMKSAVNFVTGADGTLRVRGLMIDITERKRAEEALKDQESKYRGIFEGAGVALVEGDVSRVMDLLDPLRMESGTSCTIRPEPELIKRAVSLVALRDVNARALELFDVRSKEEFAESILDFFAPETGRPFLDLITALGDGAPYFESEAVILTRSGERRDVIIAATCPADDRRLESVLVSILDITSRKQTEGALRESEERNRTLLEAIPDLIFVIDSDGRYLQFKAEHVSDLLIPPEAFLGRHYREVVPQHLADLTDSAIIAARATGHVQSFEYELKDPEGGTLRFEARLAMTAADHVVAVIRNISERRRAEAALRESELLFRTLAENTPAAIFIYRGDRYVYANPAAEILTGYSREELLGMSIWDPIHPQCRDAIMRQAAERRPGDVGPARSEVLVLTKSGEERWGDVIATAIVFEGKSSVLLTTFDITQRKNAERDLQESHRQIEQLAGRLISAQEEERSRISRELHDDLNQRVAALSISISRLKRDLPNASGPVGEHLDQIQTRMAELSDEIRRLSHQLHPAILEQVGFVPAIRSYCSEFQRNEEIEVHLGIGDGVESVSSPVGLCLYRVVQEALGNVARHSGAAFASIGLELKGNDVTISISDRGCGFDMEEARHRGGLGLISMAERVRLLGGTLGVTSRPGSGTRIEARVPLLRDES